MCKKRHNSIFWGNLKFENEFLWWIFCCFHLTCSSSPNSTTKKRRAIPTVTTSVHSSIKKSYFHPSDESLKYRRHIKLQSATPRPSQSKNAKSYTNIRKAMGRLVEFRTNNLMKFHNTITNFLSEMLENRLKSALNDEICLIITFQPKWHITIQIQATEDLFCKQIKLRDK